MHLKTNFLLHYNEICCCKSTYMHRTCSFQLDADDRGTFSTVGHNNTKGGVALQGDCQGRVAIRADTGDAEMPVVVGKGKELARA